MATLDLILLIVSGVAVLAGAVAMVSTGLRWLRSTEPRDRRARSARRLFTNKLFAKKPFTKNSAMRSN